MSYTPTNKVVLITGASSGIGQVCAELLSQKGHKVYGTSRKPNVEVRSYEMIEMDVNDEDAIAAGISHIVDKEGRLDVVVNNAGMGVAGALEDTSVEELKFQFETNFFGAFRVCQAALPTMRAQGFGYLINISSLAGQIGIPFQGAYSASKFALEGLTEVLRMEVKPFGIRTVLVQPGDFNTGFTDNRIKTQQSQINTLYRDSFNKALQVMEEDEINGAKPDSIATLVEHIINNPSPLPRYGVGPRLQRFAVQLRKFVPARLFEFVIMKTYKI
ncbi:MAG: SDR family oxidoreductase [Halioglobus sp.]